MLTVLMAVMSVIALVSDIAGLISYPVVITQYEGIQVNAPQVLSICVPPIVYTWLTIDIGGVITTFVSHPS